MLKAKTSVKFDSSAIRKYMSRETARILIRIGGWLRTVARRSMRKRKGPSPRGNPPYAHDNPAPLLRTFLLYAYDTVNRRLVVGPIFLPRGKSYVLPGLMEKGGTVQAKLRGNLVTRQYPERPYMRPALEKQGKNLLMNSLKGSLVE